MKQILTCINGDNMLDGLDGLGLFWVSVIYVCLSWLIPTPKTHWHRGHSVDIFGLSDLHKPTRPGEKNHKYKTMSSCCIAIHSQSLMQLLWVHLCCQVFRRKRELLLNIRYNEQISTVSIAEESCTVHHAQYNSVLSVFLLPCRINYNFEKWDLNLLKTVRCVGHIFPSPLHCSEWGLAERTCLETLSCCGA